MTVFHHFPGQPLSEPELMSAQLDGDVVVLGDGYVSADTVDTEWMRARSLRPTLGDALAATHRTAAWVFGHIPELNTPIDVQRAGPTRRNHSADPRFVYRDGRLSEDDTLRIGGVFVATVPRTLADLARSSIQAPDRYRATLSLSMGAARDEEIAAAEHWLTLHHRLPFARAARQLLAARDQDDVTR